MEVVRYKQSDFEKLERFNTAIGCISFESKLYYENQQRRRLIKAYKNVNDKDFAKAKLRAINNLLKFTSLHDIPELLRPDGIVLVNGKFIGDIFPVLPGYNSSFFLNSKFTPTKTKIEILKQIGLILQKIYIADKNAAFADVHADNFLVDGVNFKDLKNTSHIKTYGIDTESMAIYDSPGLINFYLLGNPNLRSLDKYRTRFRRTFKASPNTDIYCFIMMILEVISNHDEMWCVDIDEFKRYVDYLDKLGFDSNLLTSLLRIYDKTADNINPLPYLDSIKEIPKEASFSSFRKS